MTVPDEAIEAAAKAAYESTMEDGDTPWEHFGGSSYLDYYRDHARAALEAAAPYLRAEGEPATDEQIAEIARLQSEVLEAWANLNKTLQAAAERGRE